MSQNKIACEGFIRGAQKVCELEALPNETTDMLAENLFNKTLKVSVDNSLDAAALQARKTIVVAIGLTLVLQGV